ncbi:hypothetical protein CC1G_14662 [Coprinopsis cinerea okayama7|uniref:Uncharacterized protein n=1 Tax=Coprinopsis cinerea (strain Okayama-7 / 130 / ATCC MYA-4618 / FGSC 9003) TaxID=240176 RepID=D6RMR8_COPC7|nr:hypothetical protein CC1G_14662 [Coprinopsis cinerea okayama7\|eukprot:XP_002911233.1 hypothetical protein CC1G_14662 [Coprinopsis cinerea okayama7\
MLGFGVDPDKYESARTGPWSPFIPKSASVKIGVGVHECRMGKKMKDALGAREEFEYPSRLGPRKCKDFKRHPRVDHQHAVLYDHSSTTCTHGKSHTNGSSSPWRPPQQLQAAEDACRHGPATAHQETHGKTVNSACDGY